MTNRLSPNNVTLISLVSLANNAWSKLFWFLKMNGSFMVSSTPWTKPTKIELNIKLI